jgi:hypothetical protein
VTRHTDSVSLFLSVLDRATFPSGAVLERLPVDPERQDAHEHFTLRYKDYIFDWGVYDFTPRWTADAGPVTQYATYDYATYNREREWMWGRYYVKADRLLADCDPVWKEHIFGSTAIPPSDDKPNPRPTWFKERR